MVRAWVRGAVAAACALAVVGGGVPQVFAHAGLETSTPSANSVLEVGPTEIVLDFDEAIETSLTSIALYDADGRSIPLGSPSVGSDDTVVQTTVDNDGTSMADGVYAVVWRVTSADSHVIDGALEVLHPIFHHPASNVCAGMVWDKFYRKRQVIHRILVLS